MRNEFQELVDTRFSPLVWTQAHSEDLIRKTKGDFKVKKKLRLSAVIVMALVLLTATAFALYALQLSPQANAVSQARRALTAKYGLSSEAFGLLNATSAQEVDRWVVCFTSSDGIHPSLVGEYTVILENGQATASWSHDDVDPALWQSGDLTSPAWGQPQIEKALRGDPQAQEIQAALWQNQPGSAAPQPTPPDDPHPGQVYWEGQWIAPTDPPAEALSLEQALVLAKEALAQEYRLPQETLDAAVLVDSRYFPSSPPIPNGPAVWTFHLYLVHDGVEWGCGVILNGQTGEILSVDSMTGGNG
jgi:hypothetical protein